eukprot:752412-Hanusia_phi.AAC.6
MTASHNHCTQSQLNSNIRILSSSHHILARAKQRRHSCLSRFTSLSQHVSSAISPFCMFFLLATSIASALLLRSPLLHAACRCNHPTRLGQANSITPPCQNLEFIPRCTR